jgi:hypothetical protein
MGIEWPGRGGRPELLGEEGRSAAAAPAGLPPEGRQGPVCRIRGRAQGLVTGKRGPGVQTGQDQKPMVGGGSAVHREPRVVGGHERSRQVCQVCRSPHLHFDDAAAAGTRRRVRIPPDLCRAASGGLPRGRRSPRTVTGSWCHRGGLEAALSSPAVPPTCPRQRSATVAHGQQRSLTEVPDLRHRRKVGSPTLLPKLAVRTYTTTATCHRGENCSASAGCCGGFMAGRHTAT